MQIFDPFTELFEVGHTPPPTVQMHNCRMGARRSAFPVGKPHTAMRGAFALCDFPHGQ